ncbi:MAG: glycosyltransferase [Gemmatimonadaceae bacterium]
MPTPRIIEPVFLDRSGRRWQVIRRGAIILAAASTVTFLTVILSLLVPPLLPQLHLPTRAFVRPATGAPLFAGTRTARVRNELKRRLDAALHTQRRTAPPSTRRELLPVRRLGGNTQPRSGRPIVAGFYVNWDDNSFDSLNEHIDALDWIVAEWGFLAPGGDSLRITVDRRVTELVATKPKGTRPSVFAMVSNFDSTQATFSKASLRAMLSRPAARTRAIAQLRDTVTKYDLAGVTVDFEDVPEDLLPAQLEFVRALRAVLAPAGRLVTQAIPASASSDPTYLRKLAQANDKLFAMIFDEHYSASDPGPVASHQFYLRAATRLTELVPPAKLILMIGAYGYRWDDAEKMGEAVTYQEAIARARDNGAQVRFDTLSLNPYLRWTDPDSTDNVVWFLDGVTGYNEIRVAELVGAAGHGIWRLGAEDPSIWNVLGRDGLMAPPDSLARIPPGYDVEFTGDSGEVLQLQTPETRGRRNLRIDPKTALVVDEQMTIYPSPFVVRRFGRNAHRIALTFDDGPDGRWTPAILDTLLSRHAPATFFVIGENVDAHIGLMRRIQREGHEWGNHTMTHPNLALTGPKRTKLEMDANERLLEAVLDRRSAYFRPPYFGDAEPTTRDELVPVAYATERGYYTIGLRVDAQDWQEGAAPAAIIDTILAQRARGSVVLLHDGGGDRSATVAALGTLIDTLRARGDTLVLVSGLVGISRDEAMAPLATVSELRRRVELAGYWTFGVVEWGMYWLFMVAVVLGVARLFFIGGLAIAQRLLKHQDRTKPTTFAPGVSVIVPAYNEAKVIGRTVQSLITQHYAGPIEIIVVDDGSRDDTAAVVARVFGEDPRVHVHHKPNGGKASALNYGIARAHHEIVIALDADTVFATDTIAELVQPLIDPQVGAVAGNAKVGNRINLVTRWQALEYVTSQNLDRRAFALLNGITVVPGAVGAWRKSLVQLVGGFRYDTLAEDQDLTLKVRRAGRSIAYADGAIAYTEAPGTLRELLKQRFRWAFGTLQCAWKHKATLFRPRFGTLGFIALPNVWLFQLALPFFSPLADLMFVWSLLSVWLTYKSHGGTYALTSLEQVLTYYAIFLLVDWLAAVVAFVMEPGEDKRLTWLIFVQRFAYRQLMYWVVVRSFFAAVRGRLVGWGKLERQATVELPT